MEEVKLELHNLAEKLRKAREDDDFIEIDLHLWTNNLKILKAHVLDVHSSVVTIREDPSVQFIAKLNVISTSKQFEFDERLIIAYGDVSIEDNGCLAIQQSFGTSYLRSKNGFTFGQYKVRFNIITGDLGYDIIFGIISTKELLSEWPSTNYGWSTHDSSYYGGQIINDDNNNFKNDLKGKKSFTLELLIDCDNQKIEYFNEETKYRRELIIDPVKCSYPWQLFFYLYSTGDRTQLL